MATSKGRSGGTKAPAKKSSSRGSSAGSSRGGASKKSSGGGNKAAAAKKSAPKKAAPAKKAATPAKKAAAPAKKAAAPAKKAASKGSAASSGRGGATGGRGRAAAPAASNRTGATARNGAASKAASKKSAGRGGSSARGGAAAGRSDGRPNSANDLEKIFKDLLKDIYYAEKKLEKALGKMSKKATHADLKEAFDVHREQTQDQIAKLEGVFEMLGQKVQAKKCAAMDGLLEEADEHIQEYEKGPGLDAALIVGAQKVEHYEIAAYGSLRNFARVLGEEEAATVFEEILEQESDTDELLTGLSNTVNTQAYGSHEEEGGGSGNGGNKGGGRGGATADASRQADADMEDDDNAGGGGGTNAAAGSDDTGKGRQGSSLDDSDTGSNR